MSDGKGRGEGDSSMSWMKPVSIQLTYLWNTQTPLAEKDGICHTTCKPASALRAVWEEQKSTVTVDTPPLTSMSLFGLMELTEDMNM